MASLPALRTTTTVLAPGYRVATRTRTVSRVNPLAATVAFLGLTYGFFSAGSLVASVLAEQARQEALRASSRTRLAVAMEARLAERVDELSSLKSIDHWASAGGFVAPDRAPETSPSQEDGRHRP